MASVVLTIVLNVAIRLWPGGAERSARRLDGWAAGHERWAEGDARRTRVIVPWKAMLVVSIAGTILLNVVLRLA